MPQKHYNVGKQGLNVELFINGTPLNMTFDTGASVTTYYFVSSMATAITRFEASIFKHAVENLHERTSETSGRSP